VLTLLLQLFRERGQLTASAIIIYQWRATLNRAAELVQQRSCMPGRQQSFEADQEAEGPGTRHAVERFAGTDQLGQRVNEQAQIPGFRATTEIFLFRRREFVRHIQRSSPFDTRRI
jgi:hypothetical protein